ncbi:hypothetical protein V8E36_007546 [Tilletia maclaganii]
MDVALQQQQQQHAESSLAAAQALVQAELAARPPPPADEDERIPPALDDTAAFPHLSTHFARLSTGASTLDDDPQRPKLDSSRFTLPGPADGLEASEDEWKAALDNAYVQLAHQEGRAINIDLMKRYGANHWRIHNYNLESDLARYTSARTHVTDTLSASTNRTRRLLQQNSEAQLSSLEARWAALVSTQLQMGVAQLGAEQDVSILKEQRQRLQQRLAQLEAA